MSIQSLTPPQDITWTRLAFSRDMIDTNFGDMKFSPKWRSSLAVYFYIVPEEETADAYPTSRIVYLKLSCSITGWNPSEDLVKVKDVEEENGQLDDLQRTVWDVIRANGWAQSYWPCLGAIMQIAIYPNNPDEVSPDDYPYIMDFEPKKRELFEQVTEGQETLSGTANKLSVTKGTTNTQSADIGFRVMGVGVGLGAEFQQVESRTTETSRERRETSSHTTSFSQMYQLFNGYHLGTNRALFVVMPRPHMPSDNSQLEGSLINGERKLEGLQDVFLVVHMPRTLDGFCIQAGLDTGHMATLDIPADDLVGYEPKTSASEDDTTDSSRELIEMLEEYFKDPVEPYFPPLPTPQQEVKHLVITRRIVQSCGTFNENGNFDIRKLEENDTLETVPSQLAYMVGEFPLLDRHNRVPRDATLDSKMMKINMANNLNILQSQISRRMLDSASSITYEPRYFQETNTFKSLVAHSLKNSKISLAQLASKNYISRNRVKLLSKHKITTMGDLFSNLLQQDELSKVRSTRREIIDKLLVGKKK